MTSGLKRKTDLCELGASDLSSAFRSGELSPKEVVKAVLDRAEKTQAAFNAFTHIDREGALKAAGESEVRWRKQRPLSDLDGVPTTLKDILPVAGWSVRYGSHAISATPHAGDAPAVARLRGAGAVFLGQTTTPEYGWKAVTDSDLFGVTRNPWDPALTPGGSSGGAAVAAACGAGVFHLGTDGGGSVRIPASFTGVFGHKPSFGRVPFFPASSFGTVAHNGPITRRVEDAVAMLDVMSGRDPRDWTQPPMPFPSCAPEQVDWSGKRIGYWSRPCVGAVDPQVCAAIERVLADLADLGAVVETFDLPFSDSLAGIYDRHWCVGAAYRLSLIPPEERMTIDAGFLSAAEQGARYSATERMDAELKRAMFGAEMDRALTDFDFIMSPTVPILPFAAGHTIPPGTAYESWTHWASFSFPINLSQQPACSVPCGFSREGLPIGLQIIGPRGHDGAVLGAARSLEALYPETFATPSAIWSKRLDQI